MGWTVHTTDLQGNDRKILDKLGATSGIKYSTYQHGSCMAATWSMALDINFESAALTMGRIVEIYEGAAIRWKGVMAEPQRGYPWTFNALGLKGLKDNYVSVSSGVTPTYDPDTAVDGAISRGLPWRRFANSPSTTGLLNQDAPGTLGALLDQAALTLQQWWIVDERGNFRWVTDETSPSFVIAAVTTPGSRIFDNYSSACFVRYRDVTTHTVKLAQNSYSYANGLLGTALGTKEALLDVTDLGEVNAATYNLPNIANGYLQRVPPQAGFSGQLQVGPNQAFTFGGTRNTTFNLSTIKAGQMALLRGVQPDLQSGNLHPYISVPMVIFQTDYDVTSGVLTVTPPSWIPNDLAGMMTAAHSAAINAGILATTGAIPARGLWS